MNITYPLLWNDSKSKKTLSYNLVIMLYCLLYGHLYLGVDVRLRENGRESAASLEGLNKCFPLYCDATD
jgi:hypothetical protein